MRSTYGTRTTATVITMDLPATQQLSHALPCRLRTRKDVPTEAELAATARSLVRVDYDNRGKFLYA
ncbi:hypothetical protein C5613_16370 [Rhodococcus opacus]|uniref:Uncharacterized protein n=1 Tax=Rhodococcus opacus TaxID=37919 RepID=A0A2S8JBA1_RHOOP|nr:hypothetical protein C5613_16370 [Rhodococcus opacus]